MTILVVGAIHHDVIVDAPSLPRVDETLPGTGVRYAFGGKGGNQAMAAARSDGEIAKVGMVACLGRDEPADLALDTLRQAGVNTNSIQRVDTPSGMSVAISLPDGNYGAVIVSGSNQMLDAERITFPANMSWLVLQNELPASINETVAIAANQQGAKVLLNAAPARDLSSKLLDCVDVLVVNAVEAADMLGKPVEKLDPAVDIARLSGVCRAIVALTLGGNGLWVYGEHDKDAQHIPAMAVEVVSTHGAGDAFVGSLVASLAQGKSFVEAATLANVSAAQHVSTARAGN